MISAPPPGPPKSTSQSIHTETLWTVIWKLSTPFNCPVFPKKIPAALIRLTFAEEQPLGHHLVSQDS